MCCEDKYDVQKVLSIYIKYSEALLLGSLRGSCRLAKATQVGSFPRRHSVDSDS